MTSTIDDHAATQPTNENISIEEFMSRDKITAAIWLTRIVTIVSTILYLWPGTISSTWYQRAILCNAATCALHLHKSISTRVFFTQDYLYALLQEDACHYLFYSICFIFIAPISVCLIPIFLFALLHSTPYCKQILSLPSIGGGPEFVLTTLNKIEENTEHILRFIAINEIFLMPVVLLLLFKGAASLFMPFIYYRFLIMRYSSRENNYCRLTFCELGVALRNFANQSACPNFLRSFILNILLFFSHLAPEINN